MLVLSGPCVYFACSFRLCLVSLLVLVAYGAVIYMGAFLCSEVSAVYITLADVHWHPGIVCLFPVAREFLCGICSTVSDLKRLQTAEGTSIKNGAAGRFSAAAYTLQLP
jgi:hypothetical protein